MNDFTKPTPGRLVVVTGLPGMRKGVLAGMLVEALNANGHITAARAIPTTTRPWREGDRHGVNCNFASKQQIELLQARGDFLELGQPFAPQSQDWYGTTRSGLTHLFRSSQLLVKDIGVSGCRQMMEGRGELDLLICPILPHKECVMRRRLVARGMTEAEVKLRLLQAEKEFEAIVDGEFGEPVYVPEDGLGRSCALLQRRVEVWCQG